MDKELKRKIIIGATISTVLSFILFCFIFANMSPAGSPGNVTTIDDSLSKETFNTEDVYNYRESNPYGSYLIGFSTLTEHGISDDEMLYIHDVLINFAMYNKKVYNGRISFVNDSFVDTSTDSDTYRRYDFKFGINDSDIHMVSVRSSWLDGKIEIKIFDKSNKQLFDRKFDILPVGYNS